MDLSYEPVDAEMRTLYGLKLEQTRNTELIDKVYLMMLCQRMVNS